MTTSRYLHIKRTVTAGISLSNPDARALVADCDALVEENLVLKEALAKLKDQLKEAQELCQTK